MKRDTVRSVFRLPSHKEDEPMIWGLDTETDNDGGGHDGAAGLSGVGDIEAMLHICMQRTMEEFRKIKRSREPLTDAPEE